MRRLLIVLVLFAAAIAFYSVPKVIGGARAYVFGYPLVLMELTRRSMVQEIPENTFAHSEALPDHTFRQVVRPNNDTLYSIAWLDLAAEPLVLELPDTAGRYFVIPLMDAWTDVFATIGKRTRGTGAGRYFLTGPDWDGTVPVGLEHVAAPTNMVWIIGRVQINGPDDIAALARLQQGFRIADSDGSVANSTADRVVPGENDFDPSAQVEQMSGGEFLQLLAQIMIDQPPREEDASYLSKLAGIGLLAGQRFEIENLSGLEAWSLDLGKNLAHNRIKTALDSRELENGWAVARTGIGTYGTDYGTRTAVAMIGLGALPPEEAMYPNAMVDGDGSPLSGDNNYRIHFGPGQTPPVGAFWSLTMYDADGFLVDNPIGRYTLGDRDPLHFNSDGSLDILIQHTVPEADKANWLPAPAGKFAVTMRLYMPETEVLDGSWQVPPLERIP